MEQSHTERGETISAQVEAHAEAIMRAAGSSLRNYEMPGNRHRILAAVLDCYEQAYRAGADRAVALAKEARHG